MYNYTQVTSTEYTKCTTLLLCRTIPKSRLQTEYTKCTTLLLCKTVPESRLRTESEHRPITWAIPQQARKVTLPDQ